MEKLKALRENPIFAEGWRIAVICVCAVLMAVNIKTFVHTGGLYPGGATGLTVLIQRVADSRFGIKLPYTLVNVLLNAFPVYLGFRYIGRKFTLYSLLMIILTNILTDILPGYVITYDILLISIFGGIINGFVISLCLSVDATTGGTDFISIYLSQKKGMDTWNIILGINAVILLAAGLIFGWDKALYSIIFQFCATQVLHMLYKRFQQQTLLIVTDRPEEVCSAIYGLSHHGATILAGEGSYEHTEHKIVYSVISSQDAPGILNKIREIDPKAFVNVIRTTQLSGRFYYKPQE